ncbi:imidazole glycerol phosphate synthase subunit HisF [Candidatus Daviesbacteria bacterium RIFCSPLOWO2_01_FULL_38_10]|uniref:Imidazole glycerol phosphate synthase subunit HisF n=1 Tax=Candidatus Daviesbacteria bacterium GW2011_GWF2_38_6 TaxID=1618432 RepID=A0A0G0NJX0_9BACT|nr:MAG: Imidazole glycerol phosphate synthase subunit HisF [Candidatus Daviesbacteria bacterium GW2011_GWF2_38_6]OGE26305.1 MAG: imidazole glycerol phosphate synthase subunit HisF [Candidatus Daviesbacteria bacterium RIFCSPHIGHO2_02_FULL_39_41]OGE28078.1 MAG: imidazole glycerol phosphate synthase subunit HisF [Candidatus Daviesbacteria bacterium RIFCSPHIGHO2_01_FULL_38_8b]OGE38160.1 MAG: imidazole glycerol phosphate synthase subunit HisF [Candidatus Daviesbacteria bacterium RIFCSPLOWO2_01_FULL_3
MLAKRIIPCLDMTQGRVVKGIQFVNFRDAGDPVKLAKEYDKQGADELVFLDITATVENRDILLDVVRKTAKEVVIPFSVGGGVRTVSDMRTILRAGADKVSVNTGAFKNPKLISDCAKEFGSQCVVLSLDGKKVGKDWNVFINGGRTDTRVSAIDWAKKAVKFGAGEILLTSIDTDGTKKGFNVALTRQVSQAVSVPVIASGGAGKLKDFVEIFNKGFADAALAASLFHFGELTIQEVKDYLNERDIPVRSLL